jgi:hypothetical protein
MRYRMFEKPSTPSRISWFCLFAGLYCLFAGYGNYGAAFIIMMFAFDLIERHCKKQILLDAEDATDDTTQNKINRMYRKDK